MGLEWKQKDLFLETNNGELYLGIILLDFNIMGLCMISEYITENYLVLRLPK